MNDENNIDGTQKLNVNLMLRRKKGLTGTKRSSSLRLSIIVLLIFAVLIIFAVLYFWNKA